jgi:Spy/CpxP family protein refolding chaperone
MLILAPLTAILALAVTLGANAAGPESNHVSPYAGEQGRAIKTLAAQDIDDLLNGRGWGFAKAAELNGVPGPVHLLEMKDEIGLSADQVAAVQDLFETMKNQAVPLGARLVALEGKLNSAFAAKDIDEARLRAITDEIADVRGQLRYVHLATHLGTPGILTPHQIHSYNRLRGYDGAGGGHDSGHSGHSGHN